jgi:hypothetical protein
MGFLKSTVNSHTKILITLSYFFASTKDPQIANLMIKRDEDKEKMSRRLLT